MSKKEKPVYEHPWLDPKYDRPRRWPIIAVTFTVVILAALGTWLFFRYGLSARLTPTLVPTEVTITATTTVSPTPTVATPSPSTTEPDPEPPIVPDQPEPTRVPPVVETDAPAPAPRWKHWGEYQ